MPAPVSCGEGLGLWLSSVACALDMREDTQACELQPPHHSGVPVASVGWHRVGPIPFRDSVCFCFPSPVPGRCKRVC